MNTDDIAYIKDVLRCIREADTDFRVFGSDGHRFYPTGLTFGEWYRDWLDRLVERALPMLAREELAKQVTEGMSVEDVVRICGGEWQQRQFTDDWRHMECDLFATQFEIDQNDRVRRIIRHSIY